MLSSKPQILLPSSNIISKQPIKLDLQEAVRCLTFWPDGAKLITVGRFEMRIWNVKDGTQDGSPILLPVSLSASSLAVSPDGRKFATGGVDSAEKGKALLWDAYSRRIEDTFSVLAGSVCHSVHFSSDSRLLVLAFGRQRGGPSDPVKIANVIDGRSLRILEARRGTIHARLSPDDSRLAACGDRVQIWDLYSDHPPLEISQKASSVEWANNGLSIVTHSLGYFKGFITIFDAVTGDQIRRWQHEGGLLSELAPKVNPISISISPSGHVLAGISRSTLHFWNLQTTQEILRHEFKDQTRSGHVCIAYSPKADFIACGNYIYPTPKEQDDVMIGHRDQHSFTTQTDLSDLEVSAARIFPHFLPADITSDPINSYLIESIYNVFNDYVFNELPSYLLSVQDKTLHSREAIRQLLQPQIETITEESIQEEISRLVSSGDLGDCRKVAIRNLIRERIPYAIFSHRWLAIGEPTFRDLMTHVAMTGPGFEKLLMFCEKAREYGCEYVWSDTCCIDKSSSAELEEAIRSMFRWYRQAAVCIAYLAQTSSIDGLVAEEWFTRGWTLQELLAPEKITFYGKGWVPLVNSRQDGNDKTNLEFMKEVSFVTGIPTHDLMHYSPSCSRIYEKMLWAAKRRTTRIEDVAYSLLGIFDVVMPVSYGEGHWAFTRLMQIVIERSNDLSVFAWAGRSSRHSAAFPQSPSSYLELGREVALSLRLIHTDTNLDDTYRRGDRSFTMTKRGLQLKLLLVDTIMASPFRCIDGQHLLRSLQQQNLTWAGGYIEDMAFLPKLGSLYHGELAPIRVCGQPMALARYTQWAFGIIDYLRTMDNNIGQLEPGQYMCLLLGRKNPLTSASWETFEGWEKLETLNVITLNCVKQAEGRLETVWLWNIVIIREYILMEYTSEADANEQGPIDVVEAQKARLFID